ncbi:MAG: hypothetical protein ACKO8C_05455 [Candidatus Nanopelagicaceae bacterium]
MNATLRNTLIRFENLLLPSISQWLDLLNDSKVHKHMPLQADSVNAEWVKNWINHKMATSENSPFKIHSIWINDNFAGWAGIQVDVKDYELAIVLSPDYWGAGVKIFQKLVKDFKDSRIPNSLYIYLPPSRNTKKIAERFKLAKIGDFSISSIKFTKLKINVGGEGFEQIS